MALLSERKLNTIRGKALVGHASRDEILAVFGHIDELEAFLDDADDEDTFGTEGWRRAIDYPENDVA
jgi:hypothetical protein